MAALRFNPKVLLGALGLSGALGLGMTYTAPKEGLSLTSYLDSVGVPTICYGKTSNVYLGQKMTKAECEYFLRVELKVFMETVYKDVDPGTTPVGVFIAVSDWAYNNGLGNYKTSTLRAKLKAKDYRGVCGEFKRWKYAGGKDCTIRSNNCYGIIERRLDEEALCEASL